MAVICGVLYIPVFCLQITRVAYNDAFRYLPSEPRWCGASALFVFHHVHTFDARFSSVGSLVLEKS